MNLTRKSFLKTLTGFFASLCFWKKQATATPVPKLPTLNEFEGHGIESIMWAIDKEFGQENGIDPWIELRKEYEAPLSRSATKERVTWKDAPQWPRLQLMQKDAHDTTRTEITIRWGTEGESPEFTGSTFEETYLKAIEWAKTVPNSKVTDYFLLIIEPSA